MIDKNTVVVVWFSCGAASAVAAKLALKKYADVATVRIVNNPVAEEDGDNQRFLSDCERWFGVKIERCINPDYPSMSCEDVWNDRQFMSGVGGAPCTGELKKKARQYFEERNRVDWHILGFTADEKNRSDRFRLTERENMIPILIHEGYTKDDCARHLQQAGIALPRVYNLGYPNGNCIGCCKASSPTYWNHVRKHHPHIFERRAKQSREIGARLVRVKGERIFLDELDPNATGRPMKSMQIECGIFCEEPSGAAAPVIQMPRPKGV